MKRRTLLAAPLAAAVPWAAWAGADPAARMAESLRWTEQVYKAPQARAMGAWPLVAVLEHLAQSVEMSLDGYPAQKPAWFQHTAGAAAFAYFRWRGKMQHALDEPIPGAPALSQTTDWRQAALRLRASLLRFEHHSGPLQPHFAYGALGKDDYRLAHSFHIANHQDEIVLG